MCIQTNSKTGKCIILNEYNSEIPYSSRALDPTVRSPGPHKVLFGGPNAGGGGGGSFSRSRYACLLRRLVSRSESRTLDKIFGTCLFSNQITVKKAISTLPIVYFYLYFILIQFILAGTSFLTVVHSGLTKCRWFCLLPICAHAFNTDIHLPFTFLAWVINVCPFRYDEGKLAK